MTDSTGQLTPKEVRVSFNEEPRPVHRRSNASARSSGIIGRSGEHVVVCSSNSQFKRNSTLMRMKTKSRLMDQQDIEMKSSQKTPKSGTQGKGLADIEEDEFSSVEDMPDGKFFDRIQDALFNQYVIETLSGPPLIEIQQEQEEEDQMMEEVEKLQNAGAKLPLQLNETIFKGYRGNGAPKPSTPMLGKSEANSPKIKNEGITIDHLHKLNSKNISAWNMNRMMNAMNTSLLTTLDEQLLDMTGEDDEEASNHITSENEAKVAAKKIYFNVAQPGSKYIYIEDLMRFLRDDEALKTIQLFDGASETKGISKRALKNWVVNVFRERRALALSLNDTKTAVHKLHQMLNVVVAIIIVYIHLMSCDRCEIDGVQMIVEEMNILTTTFLRFDNQKIAYPNSVLSTMPIGNFHRSPDMGDAIDFCIHVSTPAEKVAKMKERITSYVENKSDHWQPGPMIVVRDVEDLNRLKISIWLSHRSNFQDMGGRWKRRALLVEEMIKIFKDLDIEYRMLPLDINVRNIPPLSSNRLPSNWTSCAN
ncbi:mechanosensitive ion channel protein 6-like protein [Tanacetum coccineum]